MSSVARWRRAPGAALPGILLVVATIAGLALRLQYLSLQEVIGTDGVWYAILGANLLHGRGYTDPTGAISTFYPPLYPLTIGLFSLVTDNLELAGRLSALVASIALVPVTYYLGKATFDRRVAAVAAVIVALLPALAENGVLVLAEALYTLLLTGGALAVITGLQARGARPALWYALAGGCLAGAGLTRPEGYPYAPIFGLLILAVAWRDRRQAGLRHLATPVIAFGVAYLAVLAPYLVFMRQQTGQWQLSGKVATNVVVAYRGAMAEEENYFALNPAGTGIGGFAADTDSLFETIRRSPAGFVKHYRLALVDEARLLSDTLSPILFALLVPGLAFSAWPRGQRLARVALLALLAQLALLPIFFLDQRFLLPMMPPLAVLAGAGVVMLASRVAGPVGPWWRGTVAWSGAILFAWLLWFSPLLLIGPLGNYNRWNQALESKAAGEWLRANAPPGQVILSRKPYVTFYSYPTGNRLVEMPLGSLDTIVAYGRRQGAGYLVIDERSLAHYRPALIPLLDGPAPAGLAIVYDWHDKPGYRIRIFKIG